MTYERDPTTMPNGGYLLGHVGHVERGREGGLGHPRVAGGVGDRLTALVFQRRGFVACPQRIARTTRGDEASHLRVGQATRRLDAHGCACTARSSGPPRLCRSPPPRHARSGCRRPSCLLHARRNPLGAHVRRADDLLRRKLVLHGHARIDAEPERPDAEEDQDDPSCKASELEKAATFIAHPFVDWPAEPGRNYCLPIL